MRTPYDDLIEESNIEDNYGRAFDKNTWKVANILFNRILKKFNLKTM
tara:strand:+ start:3937 stop:4077 length:141 start_codon:yes stop_codon:yes gene_type:complete